MGFSIYSQDKNITYNIKKFILDFPTDIEFLPNTCAPGSSAFIISNSQLYMLNTKKEWKLIPNSNSGEGGTSGITISRMYFNEKNHLICELSDGSIIDAGEIPVSTIIENKVDKIPGSSLIEDSLITKIKNIIEIKKLSNEFSNNNNQLSINEIEQDKIIGLPEALNSKISKIIIGNDSLNVDNGNVTIPFATLNNLGVVKGSTEQNKINIENDGSMIINNLNIDKIVQTPGTEIIFNNGDSKIS